MLGFADYSPALELVHALDRLSDRFARRRHDGRMVIIDRGRIADRYHRLRLDGLDLVDPYDGSLADWLYLAPGFDLATGTSAIQIERQPQRGLGVRVAAGSPARGLVQGSYRLGVHRVSIDGLVDVFQSGLTIDEDHSTNLPSFSETREIDDRGQGLLLVYRGVFSDQLRVSAGLMHRADGGYMGVWDTLSW